MSCEYLVQPILGYPITRWASNSPDLSRPDQGTWAPGEEPLLYLLPPAVVPGISIFQDESLPLGHLPNLMLFSLGQT